MVKLIACLALVIFCGRRPYFDATMISKPFEIEMRESKLYETIIHGHELLIEMTI